MTAKEVTPPSAIDEQLQIKINNGHARRMGPVENFFAIWQRQKLYKNFAVIGHFSKDIKTDPTLLIDSLRAILLKYPILLSSINKTDYSDLTVPRPLHDFIFVKDELKLEELLIEFPKEFYELSKDDRLKYINTEISWPYEDDKTLWKLAFIDNHTLVFISNHCLSDGISGINFFEDLAYFINNPTTDDKNLDYLFNYSKDFKSLPKLPKPLESVISYEPGFLYYIEYFYNLFIIKNLSYRSNFQPLREDTFHYRYINIPSKDIESLKKVLNEKKITMTPYLEATWLRSINEIITPKNNPILGYHDISTPGNARQYLPPSMDSDEFRYGANTSGVHKTYSAVPIVTWDVVNKLSIHLKNLFKTRKFLYNIGMLCSEFLANRVNLDKTLDGELMGSARNGSLFSNLGSFKATEGSYRVDDLIFVANGGSSAETFSISIVSTLDNGLNVVLAIPEKDVSLKDVDALTEHFRNGILNFNEIN